MPLPVVTTQQGIIYEELSRALSSREIPSGEALPSLRSLADRYGTSVGTIRMVLSRLKHEGRITSHHGKGHFAAEAREPALKTILLLTETEGDLWADMVRLFSDHFGADPHARLVLEKASKSAAARPAFERKIRWMVAEGVDAIIFNGAYVLGVDFLAEYANQTRLICYWSDEVVRGWPGAKVLSDNFHGGYIGTRHLLDQGARELLVLMPRTYEREGYDDLRDFLDGCEQAVADSAGAGPLHTMVHTADIPGSPGRFRECLQQHPGIDGIFSAGDFRFEHLAPILQHLGRRVPDDVRLLGYFDTPWCRAFDPQLSSVNVQPGAFVEAVGQLLETDADERVLIRPQVVVRGSSASCP